METSNGTKKFYLPDGTNWVTIREQNGHDDDILSNPTKVLTSFSQFVSAIVVDSSYGGKLTEEFVNLMPSNNKWAIIFQSRMFSISDTVNFKYDWGEEGGVVSYEQDLKELIFDDYSQTPTEEEMTAKPFAIPYYPTVDTTFVTQSGKQIKFQLLDTNGELFVTKLDPEQSTRNKDLIARNISVMIDGQWEKIQNFSNFTKREMIEIRSYIEGADPTFTGTIPVPSKTGKVIYLSVLGMQDFFFPEAF